MQTQATTEAPREYGAQLNARVPAGLREEVRDFCLVNGLKVGDFVADAVREKMMKLRRVGA